MRQTKADISRRLANLLQCFGDSGHNSVRVQVKVLERRRLRELGQIVVGIFSISCVSQLGTPTLGHPGEGVEGT